MLNKVLLIGRLGADPEVHYTNDGKPVVNFRLATSEKWIDRTGDLQERTEWHRIVAFGRLADFCAKALQKGKMVFVEGTLRSRSYEDREGNTRYVTEIVAGSIRILASPQKDGREEDPGKREETSGTEGSPERENGEKYEEDLPF